jgi:2'-5' RNA ligase
MWWWYLTFESDPEVRRLAAGARAAIRPEAPVRVVPEGWLHLTVAEVGHLDAVPRRLLDRCARLAREYLADLPAIDLRVGLPATMPGAVVLPVSADGLVEVYDRLVAALEETMPRQPVQRAFEPHVSVAYVDRDCRRADVLDEEVVERCEPGWSRAAQVSLVEVTRDDRHYRWTSRCQVPLTACRAPRGGLEQHHGGPAAPS